jgi:hypothetical protein
MAFFARIRLSKLKKEGIYMEIKLHLENGFLPDKYAKRATVTEAGVQYKFLCK